MSKLEIKDPAAIKYFGMVEASALKLDRTLISLVQSMTMRDMAVHMEDIDFNEIVNEILSQLRYHEGFQKLKITVHNQIFELFRSNKLILTSVFQNLIQNAIKYQNYNSAGSFLNITITTKKKMLEILFEDNGIGIEDFLQEKIFDMYFRGTSSVSGSGLGLYIVKIGVEKLNGKISFKSKKGEGTSFIIQLPFAKDQIIIS
jgi:signal transduction histidine kinase